MFEKFITKELLAELPNALIVFLWYIWETYCDLTVCENRLILAAKGSMQKIIIASTDKVIEKDFGTSFDMEILFYKEGLKCYMSRR